MLQLIRKWWWMGRASVYREESELFFQAATQQQSQGRADNATLLRAIGVNYRKRALDYDKLSRFERKAAPAEVAHGGDQAA